MNIFVINLDYRTDRLQHIQQQLYYYPFYRHPAFDGRAVDVDTLEASGWIPDYDWEDPLLKRNLTLTEIGCFISHYECWEKIVSSGEPGIIFEDDIEVLKRLDVDLYQQILSEYDILYLGYREMSKIDRIGVGDNLVIPIYPYLLSSYCLSPAGAKKLIDTHVRTKIIPADEYVPLMIGYDYSDNIDANSHMRSFVKDYQKYPKLKAVALVEPAVKQISRSILGSDIEGGPLMNTKSNKTHVITVATDESKASLLIKSATRNNILLNNLGAGVVWEGGDMTGPGGGQKINLVKNFLTTVDDGDNVLFVDGYDVLINDDLPTVLQRFLGFECDILFAAEKTCWPDKSLEEYFPSQGTEYRFLNSGLYIGKAKALKQLFADPIPNRDDDQLYMQQRYLKQEELGVSCKLDVENYLFQCIAKAASEVGVKENKQLINTSTRCCPCILHGNGGAQDKSRFEDIAATLGYSSNSIDFLPIDGSYEVVAPDILTVDFMTPDECQRLIDKAEAFGKWESMYGDKFPGQELRIHTLDIALFNKLEQHFKDYINKVVEKYWWPLQMYGLRDAFIIKYSPDTQSKLACHHDASLVSGIVRLNDNYDGGGTYFYRQNYNTENVPVGKMVLWPGQVTHGHEGREVSSGTKYALVIWTCRRQGDINY